MCFCVSHVVGQTMMGGETPLTLYYSDALAIARHRPSRHGTPATVLLVRVHFSKFSAARFALETPRDKGPLFKQREEYFGLFKTIAKLPDVCPLDSEAAICRVVTACRLREGGIVLSFSGGFA
jgi:hypothetical protein